MKRGVHFDVQKRSLTHVSSGFYYNISNMLILRHTQFSILNNNNVELQMNILRNEVWRTF